MMLIYWLISCTKVPVSNYERVTLTMIATPLYHRRSQFLLWPLVVPPVSPGQYWCDLGLFLLYHQVSSCCNLWSGHFLVTSGCSSCTNGSVLHPVPPSQFLVTPDRSPCTTRSCIAVTSGCSSCTTRSVLAVTYGCSSCTTCQFLPVLWFKDSSSPIPCTI